MEEEEEKQEKEEEAGHYIPLNGHVCYTVAGTQSRASVHTYTYRWPVVSNGNYECIIGM